MTTLGHSRPPAGDRLMALLYRSRTALTRSDFAASGAPVEFARRNAERQITGYLHLEDGQFFQHIEGPAEAVTHLWSAIQADPRHRDVALVSHAPASARRFAGWAMGYDITEARSLFDWTARSGLSIKGPKQAQVVVAFMEYASAGLRRVTPA